jgi:hypothetical protein
MGRGIEGLAGRAQHVVDLRRRVDSPLRIAGGMRGKAGEGVG